MGGLSQILANRVQAKLPVYGQVHVEPFDYGRRFGASAVKNRQRHAVIVEVSDYDLTAAADECGEALAEWMGL